MSASNDPPLAVRALGDEADGSGLLLMLTGGEARIMDSPSEVACSVPLHLHGHVLMLLELEPQALAASTDAPARRAAYAEAAGRMGVQRLRDAQIQDLHLLPDHLAALARHALAENGRVLQAIEALRLGRVEQLGLLLDASHAGLRDGLGASPPAAEASVRELKRMGAIGARLLDCPPAALGLLPPGAAVKLPASGRRLVPAHLEVVSK